MSGKGKRKNNGRGRRPKRLAENENDGPQQRLVRYGAQVQESDPVAGLVRAPVLLCPAATRVLMKYAERISLSSAAGLYVEYNWSGNGLFDPNVTGTGTQPTGFDQWCAFYQRYRVLASHVRIRAINPGAATNAAAMTDIAIVPTNTTTAFANSQVAASQPYAKRQLANTIGTGPNGFLRLEGSMETDLILGTSRQAVLTDDTYSGSSSANPSNQWYWRICQEPADLASTQNTVYEVELTYLVDFYERQLNVASVAAGKPGKVLRRTPTS